MADVDAGMTVDEARAGIRDALMNLVNDASMEGDRLQAAKVVAELVSFLAQLYSQPASAERRRDKIRAEYLALVRSTQSMISSLSQGERAMELEGEQGEEMTVHEYCVAQASGHLKRVYGEGVLDDLR